jgi:tRNA (cytidine/uridine-2'-O-)-methyltransferase
MHIALVNPQIPPNTGNVARLCAAVRIPLHLVGTLGFQLSDRHLKRAGLDYWEFAEVHRHTSVEGFLADLPDSRLHFFSKRGARLYTEVHYREADYLVFGSETDGLPSWIFERYPKRIRAIPMLEKRVRSLNLSSSVAIVVYEALRQTGAFAV